MTYLVTFEAHNGKDITIFTGVFTSPYELDSWFLIIKWIKEICQQREIPHTDNTKFIILLLNKL
jgi:hypothetical protein